MHVKIIFFFFWQGNLFQSYCMFQALKKLLHVMPWAVEFICVQLWHHREHLFTVAEKTIGYEL